MEEVLGKILIGVNGSETSWHRDPALMTVGTTRGGSLRVG
jgi:hypothetical protein